MQSRRNFRPVHRTVQGRVVYDRPKHVMKLADGLRILRSIDLLEQTPDDLLDAFVQIKETTFKIMTEVFQRNLFNAGHIIDIGIWLLRILQAVYASAGGIATGLWEKFKAVFGSVMEY
jgi:hypothetical protein